MVRSLVALVLRRVLAWLVRSNEHAKDLEIVVVPVKNPIYLSCLKLPRPLRRLIR